MKKVFLIAVAILCFNSNAQQDKSFGAKAGVNIAQINAKAGNMSDSFDNLVGFHFGLFGEFKLANQFTIQPEALFSRLGGTFNEDGTTGDIKLNYISVPIMFKYYPSEQFSLEAGPQIGFLASSTISSGALSVDAESLFNTIDFGLAIGANYDFTDKVFVNARYNLGLSNIMSDLYKTATADALDINSNTVSFKNSYFQIGLGLKF